MLIYFNKKHSFKLTFTLITCVFLVLIIMIGSIFLICSENQKNKNISVMANGPINSDSQITWITNGNYANSFADGTGTVDDPYLIETPEQLAYLSYMVYSGNAPQSSGYYYNGTYFKQIKDLDMSKYYWQPIGAMYDTSNTQINRYFGGSYDGGGHKITGVYTYHNGTSNNSDKYKGLFGYIQKQFSSSNTTIKNIVLENSIIKGSEYVGGIVGYGYGDSLIIENCINSAEVIGSTNFTGGIVGWLSRSGSVKNCKNTGAITGATKVGGIAGGAVCYNSTNSANVEGSTYVGGISGEESCYNCSNTGAVKGSGYVGGIVGSGSSVTGCKNEGNVNANESSTQGFIGGIAGEIGTIGNCVNYGDVNSYGPKIGGIAGEIWSTEASGLKNFGNITANGANSYVGGIIGYFSSKNACTLTNSHNYGSVNNGGGNTGGVVGSVAYNTSLTISKCSNNNTVTSSKDEIGGIISDGGKLLNIDNCFNSGAISTIGSIAGGLVGTIGSSTFSVVNSYNRGSVSANATAGGIVGEAISSLNKTIKNCFNVAEINASSNLGTIAGTVYNSNLVINNFYYGGLCGEGTPATGVSTSITATYLSTIVSDAKTEQWYTTIDNWDSSYAWNFKTIWQFKEEINAGYPVFIETWIDIENYADSFAGGTGEKYNPYIIETAEQLARLSALVYNKEYFSGVYFKQVADIDLSAYPWEPIGKRYSATGSMENGFCGNYDGGGFKISGIKILYDGVSSGYSNDYKGLFGYVYNSELKNINVCDSEISGSQYVGGIVGQAGYNVSIKYCSNSAIINGKKYVGGIAGEGQTINNCYNNGNVTSSGDYAGGIAGNALNIIDNTYNRGSVSGQNYVGGLIGNCASNYVANNFNIGNVIATGNYKGGIVGASLSDTYLKNSYYGGDCQNIGASNGADNGTSTYLDNLAVVAKDVNWYQNESNWNSGYSWDMDMIWEIDALKNDGYPIVKPIEFWIESADKDIDFEGEGTEASPYKISSEQELAGLTYLIATQTGDYSTKYYQQTKDLDMSGKVWTPIGLTNEIYFSGGYDGGNFTISGITVSESFMNGYDYFGLFGYIKGSESKQAYLKNLSLSNSTITGFDGSKVGGLVGYINYGDVISCNTTDSVTVKGKNYTAGIVGANETTTVNIKNCYNSATIIGEGYVAGIMAYGSCGMQFTSTSVNLKYNVLIENCYNTGRIIDEPFSQGYEQRQYVAGIISASIGVIIQGCYNSGEVDGPGIVLNGMATQISNCYNDGIVQYAGIAGELMSAYAYGRLALIKDCYNIGTVKSKGGAAAAGIVYGAGNYTNIENCFNGSDLEGHVVAGICGVMIGDMGPGSDDEMTKILNCYNTGNIKGVKNPSITELSYAGGIVGSVVEGKTLATISACYNKGDISGETDYAGGIIGDFKTGQRLSNCYNLGAISVSTQNKGGIAGANAGRIEFCYYGGNCENIGGIAGSDTSTVKYSSTISTDAKTKEWHTNPYNWTGDGTSWDFNNLWALAPSINEGYAFLRNGYTSIITADANGGMFGDISGWTVNGNVVTKRVGYEMGVSSFPNVTKEGFEFIGWYTQQEGGEKIDLTTKFVEDTTIYAHWLDTWQNHKADSLTMSNGKYVISSAEELAYFAYQVNQQNSVYSTASYIQTADIDLSQYCWIPIGIDDRITFSGNYDGQGHEISGIITGVNNPFNGLFGSIIGSESTFTEIKNLTIKDSDMTAGGKESPLGALAGVAMNANVKNCKVVNVKLNAGYVGGFFGMAMNVSFDNCHLENSQIIGSMSGGFVGAGNVTSVTNSTVSGIVKGYYAAGFVSQPISDPFPDIIFTNCINYCDVVGLAGGYDNQAILGGIIAYAASNNNITLNNVTNYGNIYVENLVQSSSQSAGGIFGALECVNCELNRVCNYGDVTIGYNGSGFIGQVRATKITINNGYNLGNINALYTASGFISEWRNEGSADLVVSNAFNIGKIEGAITAGICGYLEGLNSITLTDVYNSGTINGYMASGGVGGALVAQTIVLDKCLNVGDLQAGMEGGGSDGSGFAGGLFGMLQAYVKLDIQNCFVDCKTTLMTQSGMAGGLIFQLGLDSSNPDASYVINNCGIRINIQSSAEITSNLGLFYVMADGADLLNITNSYSFVLNNTLNTPTEQKVVTTENSGMDNNFSYINNFHDGLPIPLGLYDVSQFGNQTGIVDQLTNNLGASIQAIN